MKKLFFLLMMMPCLLSAQRNSIDSIYIARLDSIIESKKNDYKKYTTTEMKDTMYNRSVYFNYVNDKLSLIYYRSVDCESAVFGIENDTLIFVQYILADPDIRSLEPPKTSYLIYYLNDKPIHISSPMLTRGGAKTCGDYNFESKNFLEEYYYYKSLEAANHD